jgi:hypothetical protein
MLNQNQPKTPSNWPFPITNGERSDESQNLIDGKHATKEKIDIQNYEEALF